MSLDGLKGIGMGLGPGGIPIDANHLNKGLGMGNLGPGGEYRAAVQLFPLQSLGFNYFSLCHSFTSHDFCTCWKGSLNAYFNIVCAYSTQGDLELLRNGVYYIHIRADKINQVLLKIH